MAASSKKTANKQPTTARLVDSVELAELVKLAVAETIKESVPTLVEDVVSQLTNKTQAHVDAQVAVFHGEMGAMRALICFWTAGGSRSTRREPTHTRGEHANSTHSTLSPLAVRRRC